MTHRTTTRTTARTAAALAVLGAVALGSATACASGSAVNAGGSSSVSGTPSTSPSVVVPVPASTTPSAGTGTSIQPGGPNIPAPSSSGSGSASTATKVRTANSYSAVGTTLSVHFYGGICEKYGLHADESVSGEVKVTVVVTQGPKPGQMCAAVLTPQTVSTTLGSPLDGRKVVDTTTGKTLPLADPMPSDGIVTHGPTKP